MRPRAGAVIAAYAALALLVVPVFPHFLSPNEVTRWATAAALVENGTPEITRLAPLLGPAFEDVAEKDGRLYSNKAPGLALLATPGFLAARPFAGAASGASMRASIQAMRLVGATLPVLLLAILFVRAAGRLGGEVTRAPVVLLALLFGTPLFAYGLLLFSHALVAFALFGAWAALFVPGGRRETAVRDVAAGALLGLAVLSEYPAALPALILLAAASWRRGVLRPARIALGGAPFAVLLLVWNRVCFGGFFELSSAHEKFAGFNTLAGSGVFGIGFPSWAGFWGLLADPSKGLLVFSPFLVLWPRAFYLAGRVLSRPAAVALGLVPLSLLFLYAGYPNWHGGFTVGPRYLVAAVPFLVFPYFFRGGGRLEATLVGASVVAVTATTLAFPFVPPGFAFPWVSFAGYFFERGLGTPSLLHQLLPAGGAVVVAAPVVLVLIAVFSSFGGKSRIVAFCVGVAFWVGIGFAGVRSFPPPPSLRLQRAYVEDVYFGRSGALEREIATTGVPQPRLLARRDREKGLPPVDWPF